MIVEALQLHRAAGVARKPGDRFHVNDATGQHLVASKLARVVDEREDWSTFTGRELRVEPLAPRPWPLVVACLNIWNDRPALEQTLPTWIAHVDALVVADGPYATTGVTKARSTDGLAAFLSATAGATTRTVVQVKPEVWETQNRKRTALLQSAADCYPGALLFIVDADEFVTDGDQLHQTPDGDVIWVTVSSPIYRRPYGQPRLVRAREGLEYRGRHHWLYAGDRLLATHQYGGTGVEHRLSPVSLRNARGLGQSAARAQVKRVHMVLQHGLEAPATTGPGAASDQALGAREALRIAACTTYDPGMVAYRLHTALNVTTPHASVFFRRGADNPFQSPRQYDIDSDPGHAAALLAEADVVHCHLDYTVPDSLQVRPKALVIHHHGTMLRRMAGYYAAVDHMRADLRLVSNFELLSYGGGQFHWLPNPMPVARLRRLRAQEAELHPRGERVNRPFRVAHSPSKRALKGTDAFLAACAQLAARGIPIEPVLIEGLPLAESLRLKATCDACFDSFWLGLQCSGLEAGAMDLPVIAGDLVVRDRYQEHVGQVPYTFAEDGPALAAALERLATDPAWAASEGARLGAYVETWHDEAAVALRYLDLLDAAIGWRSTLAVLHKSVPAAAVIADPANAAAGGA